MQRQDMVMAVAVVATLCAGMSRAAARQRDAKAAAEQLFVRGRALMKQGKAMEACPKFEASLKLDPALGTLLNLADCYEQIGRLASAWARYRELESLAMPAGQKRRARLAHARATALEPRLPRLTIRVPLAAQVPRLTLLRDGVTVEPALFGTPVYVDPGIHEVRATAPGRTAFETRVAAVEAEEVTVLIPELPHLLAPTIRGTAGRRTDQGADSRQAPAVERKAGDGASSGRRRRLLGLSAGGVGLAMLAAGLGSGWSAASTWNRVFEQGLCNRDTLVCTAEGQAQADRARGRATLSNVLIGAGAGLAAVGVVLYVATAESRDDRRTARLVPTIGADAFGVALAGGF